MNFAIFDLDGTLGKGYASMQFLEYATGQGLYRSRVAKDQDIAVTKYKKGEISYEQWCEDWGKLWARGFAGQRKTEVQEATLYFFKRYKKNIFQNSRKLVDEWKKKGFVPIIVSTGYVEIAMRVAGELGITQFYGTDMMAKRGILQDELITDLHLPNGKENLVAKLCKTAEKTAGFGDSMGDIGFLRLVDYPHAVNPSKELESVAKKEGWPILKIE